MEALVEDPLVLEAALALVDEWYADAERGGKEAGKSAEITASVPPMSPQGLRKRTRDEVMWLRSSVQHLHDRATAKRRCLQPRVIPISSDEESEESGEETGTAVVSAADRGAQARRLLQAVQTYNRVRAATYICFDYRERNVIRPLGDERILATLNSRLDTLARIADANAKAGLSSAVCVPKPILTGSGFRAQMQRSYVLPFKFSEVVDAMWDTAIDGIQDAQMAITKPHELFAMLESSNETPSGGVRLSGPVAMRHIFQPDGTVLEIFTSVYTGSPDSDSDHDSPNLLAGCVVKQAGWARARRAPETNSTRAGRPLVSIEMSQSIVVEALPGHSISTDRLRRFWDAVLDPVYHNNRNRKALENRLMERQLATKTRPTASKRSPASVGIAKEQPVATQVPRHC